MKKEYKIQDLQILEALLAGTLTGEEKKIVEEKLGYDPDLVHLYETLMKLPTVVRKNRRTPNQLIFWL
jgi:hypothetical protein